MVSGTGVPFLDVVGGLLVRCTGDPGGFLPVRRTLLRMPGAVRSLAIRVPRPKRSGSR